MQRNGAGLEMKFHGNRRASMPYLGSVGYVGGQSRVSGHGDGPWLWCRRAVAGHADAFNVLCSQPAVHPVENGTPLWALA